jgi:hypothetical protein
VAHNIHRSTSSDPELGEEAVSDILVVVGNPKRGFRTLAVAREVARQLALALAGTNTLRIEAIDLADLGASLFALGGQCAAGRT